MVKKCPFKLRFAHIGGRAPTHAWLTVLHHQVVEYPATSIGLRDRIGLALINAPDVLTATAPHAPRTLVLHGHRHRDWIGICGSVILCSGSSTPLGSYSGEMYQGSFHVQELATGVGGSSWADHHGTDQG